MSRHAADRCTASLPVTSDGDHSRSSVRALVRAFEQATLPRDAWTHHAHLVVGLWYVLHHGEQRAVSLMGRAIRRYNAATGRTPAERGGFDAAVTRRWIARIADWVRRRADTSPGGTIFRRIATGPLAAGHAGLPSGESTPSGWSTLLDPAARAILAGMPDQDDTGQESREQVTHLLQQRARGEDVVSQLFGLVYDELCAIAAKRMQAEREGHTLQATALVHEAYARLVKDQRMDWSSRRHFFGAAAQAMRRILVDHARYVKAQRRGSGKPRMSFTLANAEQAGNADDPDRMLAIEEALTKLEQEDERAASVVRLRYFAGLTLEETADALDVSVRTVKREWTFARTRLFVLLS